MEHIGSIESILYEATPDNLEDIATQLYEELVLIGDMADIEKLFRETPPLGDESLSFNLMNLFSNKGKKYAWLNTFIKNNNELINTNTTLNKTSKIINSSIGDILHESDL